MAVVNFIVVDNTKGDAHFTPRICERIADLGYGSVRVDPCRIDSEMIQNAVGLILSGSRCSVAEAPNFDGIFKANVNLVLRALHARIPILGICYGFQAIAQMFDGDVQHLFEECDGEYKLSIVDTTSVLFRNVPKNCTIFHSHYDLVTRAPKGFHVTGTSTGCENCVVAIENVDMMIFGTQFHPEALDASSLVFQNFANFCLAHASTKVLRNAAC